MKLPPYTRVTVSLYSVKSNPDLKFEFVEFICMLNASVDSLSIAF